MADIDQNFRTYTPIVLGLGCLISATAKWTAGVVIFAVAFVAMSIATIVTHE